MQTLILNGRRVIQYTPQEIDEIRLKHDIAEIVQKGWHKVSHASALALANEMPSAERHHRAKGAYTIT